MTWREELKRFKKDPDVDNLCRGLTSLDEDTMRFTVAIIANKYPSIGKLLTESITSKQYYKRTIEVEDESYEEARCIDYQSNIEFFREMLYLFKRKKLLNKVLINECRDNGKQWVSSMYIGITST